jgi:hypothetical protein
MDLEETEARNECVSEGQQQSNRPTDERVCVFGGEGQLVSECPLESPPREVKRSVVVKTPLVEEKVPFEST